jgi:hypothetical protein
MILQACYSNVTAGSALGMLASCWCTSFQNARQAMQATSIPLSPQILGLVCRQHYSPPDCSALTVKHWFQDLYLLSLHQQQAVRQGPWTPPCAEKTRLSTQKTNLVHLVVLLFVVTRRSTLPCCSLLLLATAATTVDHEELFCLLLAIETTSINE